MEKRMKELIEIINKADIEYYQENNPTLSDYEYDKYVDELLKLENKTGIILENSPSNKVNGDVSKSFIKVEHSVSMLSLNKTKDVDEIKVFLGKNKAVLSYKMDGLTLVAYYKGRKLDKLVTRGNGKLGEDITRNYDLFSYIPKELNDSVPEDIVIRGEAVMSYETFNNVNEKSGLEYKNPRNLASGLCRSLSVKEKGLVDFVAYEICNADNIDYSSQLELLKENGFNTVQNKTCVADEIDSLMELFSADKTDYPVDGLVFRLDNSNLAKSLGTTSKFPKYAMAFKWKDDTVLTKLTDIEFSVARTGVVTPVAVFEPVEIEGTTVERASLHNLSTLKSFKMGIGDELEVYKANMIIPQVLKNHTMSNTFKIPKKCPVCGQELFIEEGKLDGVLTLNCHNHECPAKNISALSLFVSKEGFDIVGLSDKTLELFISNGFIKDIKDIFNLHKHKSELINLPSFGQKSYDNLVSAIEKSKKITADKFIRAFGIELIGSSTAHKMFEGKSDKDTIKTTLKMSQSELMDTFLIGEVAAKNIVDFNKKDIILEILDIVEIVPYGSEIKSDSLKDKNFVITGKLETISRKGLESLIKENGGNIQSSVNNKTSYLINNDSTSNSSKNKKAKELGVTIITEKEMLEMI